MYSIQSTNTGSMNVSIVLLIASLLAVVPSTNAYGDGAGAAACNDKSMRPGHDIKEYIQGCVSDYSITVDSTVYTAGGPGKSLIIRTFAGVVRTVHTVRTVCIRLLLFHSSGFFVT